MVRVVRVLAGLALLVPAAGHARPRKALEVPPASGDSGSAIVPSDAAKRVAAWIAATGDNYSLPWAVVDKANAALFLFDPHGKPLGAVPVLIGIAVGDEASPGVGSKKLGEIGPAAHGKTGRVVLTFDKPGTYTYVCGIADHEEKGMTGTFTVAA